jgi:hypothetical protein
MSLERVWVTTDGRAKLLDFSPPETDKFRESQLCAPTPQQFLKLVATSALRGRSGGPGTTASATGVPLPLHASRFLETLSPDADLNQCVAALRPLLSLPARTTRAKRALLLGGALAFPVLVAGLAWGITAFKRSVLNAAPELATLNECLTHYDQLQRKATSQAGQKEDLEAFEIYIAGRLAHLVNNTLQWDNPVTKAVIVPRLREEAEQIIGRKHSVGAEELAAASARLEQFFKKSPELAAREAIQNPNLFLAALAVGYISTAIFVIIPCLLASLLFRGGALVRLLGIVLVDRNGLPVSRWRVTARNLIAWLPFALIMATVSIHEVLPIFFGFVVILLAAISLLLPNRSLQDRLAGTWLVPR